MAKKDKIIIAISVSIVAALLIVATVLMAAYMGKSAEYQTRLENQYQKNYNELIDNVDDIEVGLSKLIATTSKNSQQALLQDVYVRCILAGSNLNGMPVNNRSVDKVNLLINKIGGYTYSLIEADEKLSTEALNSLEALHSSISVIKYDLNKGYGDMVDSNSIANANYNEDSGSNFTAGLVSGETSYSDIPTLIYDGPFSDSVINKTPKELEEEIDEAAARAKLEKLSDYWDGYGIEYSGKTDGKLVTYNYNLTKGYSKLFVQILCNGGKLLNITSRGKVEGDRISDSEAINIAKSVAFDFGYGALVDVWKQTLGDILYINLAPVEDGVIYYPDLIKVKIDLNGGVVSGFEATNYIYNHTDREGYSCKQNLAECQGLLSPKLQVVERNYAVIPGRYVGEVSAFEYVCTWSDYTYYVYLDANTGEELKIMRVINTDNGDLLM